MSEASMAAISAAIIEPAGAEGNPPDQVSHLEEAASSRCGGGFEAVGNEAAETSAGMSDAAT